MAKTAVSILEEARASIKKSTWICNTLDACTVNKKGAIKHMACAIGIVSLAAGGKAVSKRTQETVLNGVWNGDFLEGGTGEAMITTYFATYPSEKWSRAAREAALFLALAVPADGSTLWQDVLLYASGNKDVYDYINGVTITRATDPLDQESLSFYTERVTTYNDGTIKTAAEARKWFTQAIKLAKLGRKDAIASLQSA